MAATGPAALAAATLSWGPGELGRPDRLSRRNGDSPRGAVDSAAREARLRTGTLGFGDGSRGAARAAADVRGSGLLPRLMTVSESRMLVAGPCRESAPCGTAAALGLGDGGRCAPTCPGTAAVSQSHMLGTLGLGCSGASGGEAQATGGGGGSAEGALGAGPGGGPPSSPGGASLLAVVGREARLGCGSGGGFPGAWATARTLSKPLGTSCPAWLRL